MIKLIAAAGFLVAVATSAHAITPAPIPQPDGVSRKFAWGAARFDPSCWYLRGQNHYPPYPPTRPPSLPPGLLSRAGQSSHDFTGCNCATDCAIQCVGLPAVASGKPALYLAPHFRGAFSWLSSRPPDTETNGLARRFVGGLPPMLELHRCQFLWCGLRQAASPFLEVSEQKLSPASRRGFFCGRALCNQAPAAPLIERACRFLRRVGHSLCGGPRGAGKPTCRDNISSGDHDG